MLAERPAWLPRGGLVAALPPLLPRSYLEVSPCEYILGATPPEPLVLRWELTRKTDFSPTDWIGLYRTDEIDPSCYIECKTRWPNASSRGQLLWTIERVDFFTEDVTKVCFKYYHGSTGALRAVSPVVTVRRVRDPASSGPQSSHGSEEVLVGYSSQQFPVEMVKFTLSKVCARGLKRGLLFSPDPYLKISIQPGRGEGVLLLPHHGQLCRTAVALATTHPCWPGQFEFIAYPTDLLEFEVKDKFAKSRPIISRFLGKFSIQICFLLDQCTGVPIEFCFSLCNKNPSDHVSGQLLFTFTLENDPVDPWTHIRQVHNPIYATDISSSDSQIPHLPETPVPPTTPPRPPSIAANGGRQPLRRSTAEPEPPLVRRLADSESNSSTNGVAQPVASTSANSRPARNSDANPPRSNQRSGDPEPVQSAAGAATASANSGRKTPIMRSSQRSMGDLNLDAMNPVPQPARRDSNIETSSIAPIVRSVQRTADPDVSNVPTATTVATTVTVANGRPARRDSNLDASNAVPQPPSLRRPTDEPVANARPRNTPRPSSELNSEPEEVAPQPPRRASRAFTNMEYVLHPVEDSIDDVPPPLPPKQKGHRPLERVRGGTPVEPCGSDCATSQSNNGTAKPEDSFLLEIVDTDEQGDTRDEEAGTSSSEDDREGVGEEEATGGVAPPSPPRRTSSGVACRPNALPLKQQDSGPAPLATPEHDSLHEGVVEQETYLSLSEASATLEGESEAPGSYSACCCHASPASSQQTLSEDSEDNAHNEDEATGGRGVVMSTSSLSLLSTPDSVRTPVSPGLVVSPSSSSNSEGTPTDLWGSRRNSLGPMVGGRSLSFCGGPREHLTLPQHLPVTARLPSIPERTIRYQRVNPEEPLPPHWEARIDSHGRVFYIDHLNRTTTWSKPSTSASSNQLTLGTASELQRQQLDRRYQSIRRTMTSRPCSSSASGSTSSTSEEGGGMGASASESQRLLLMRSPPVCFLSRPDFLSVLHMNDDALAVYNRSSSLKHMIMKIRRDPSGFERYQHNRDLVSLLNKFADTTRELPRGWETKLDRAGKQFFIDHTSRSTTFIDPRLPIEAPPLDPNKLPLPPPGGRRRSRSAGEEEIRPDTAAAAAAAAEACAQPVPPPRPSASGGTVPHVVPHVPTAYNDKVVAFLRQPNILDILRERHPAIASSQPLRDKVAAVRADGTAAIERFSCDVDLTILLSLFEQEIMSYIPAQFNNGSGSSSSSNGGSHRSPRTSPQPSPQASPGLQRANVRAPAPYRRDFEAKLRNFYRKLESKGFGQGPGKLKLNIRRDHLLEDAFTKIMAASKKDLQKSRLYISFAGEEGLDYGGPSREFFFLLSRELFNPYYGLFEYSANDTYTVQVSPMSAFVDNAHEWFRFSGRVLGLALVHQYLLDAFFTRPFYKAMLRLPCSLSDLEYLDAEFHQSLLWLKEHDISESGLELTFCVTEEVAGSVVERELRANGKATPVSERNKKEYIERMLRWRLERGVAEQTESLVKGFYEVVDPRLVSVFDARELELVIAGTAEIDICDWRKNTDYRSGYHDNHPVIEWFWLAIGKFDNERRLRLLQFVTGTSSVPYEGFAALRGSNGPRKFCIEKWGKPTSLPRAHTCFNRLDLPPYTTYEMLYEKLLLAVEESSTFGIE